MALEYGVVTVCLVARTYRATDRVTVTDRVTDTGSVTVEITSKTLHNTCVTYPDIMFITEQCCTDVAVRWAKGFNLYMYVS